MVIFHSYVSLPEGNPLSEAWSIFLRKCWRFVFVAMSLEIWRHVWTCCRLRHVQNWGQLQWPLSTKNWAIGSMLATGAFTCRSICTHKLSHAAGFFTEVLLRRGAFTRMRFYTERFYTVRDLFHTESLGQVLLPTKTLTHREAITHRGLYTQKLLHRDSCNELLVATNKHNLQLQSPFRWQPIFQVTSRGYSVSENSSYLDTSGCLGSGHSFQTSNGLWHWGFLKWGYPNSWMVYFMENPIWIYLNRLPSGNLAVCDFVLAFSSMIYLLKWWFSIAMSVYQWIMTCVIPSPNVEVQFLL